MQCEIKIKRIFSIISPAMTDAIVSIYGKSLQCYSVG